MCTCFFYFPNQNSKIPFFISFNRDENPLRETLSLDYWEEDKFILGGRDMLFKGSWFCLNIKNFNIAFLTNLEDDELGIEGNLVGKKSRGKIIREFVATDFYSNNTVDKFIQYVLNQSEDFNPFNLVIGNLKSQEFYFIDIFNKKCVNLKKGEIMGFSNNLFQQTKWLKVEQGLKKLNSLEQINIDSILEVMENTNQMTNCEKTIQNLVFKVPKFKEIKPGLTATISCSILIIKNQQAQFYEKTYSLTHLKKIKKFMLSRKSNSKIYNVVRFMQFLMYEKNFEKEEIVKTTDFVITN